MFEYYMEVFTCWPVLIRTARVFYRPFLLLLWCSLVHFLAKQQSYSEAHHYFNYRMIIIRLSAH